MYYERPEDDSLYGLDAQYLFGPDMIISPITKPSGSESAGFEEAVGSVEWSVYAPAGGWVDRLNGDFFSRQRVTRFYGIGDVPGFVREGAVIPMRPRARGESWLGRAIQPLSSLEFRVMPAQAFYANGDRNGSGFVVDDDGLTRAYQHHWQTVTTLEYIFHARSFKINVSQAGDFDGRPTRVTLKISFPQLPPMKVVSSTGVEAGKLSIDYDDHLVGPVLAVENVDLAGSLEFVLAFEEDYDGVLSKFPGTLGHVRHARYVKAALSALLVEGYKATNLTSVALTAQHMSPAFAAGMHKLWTDAQTQVMDMLDYGKFFRKDLRRYTFVSQMLIGATPFSGGDEQTVFA